MAALLVSSSISIFHGVLMDTGLYLHWPHAIRVGYPFQFLLGPLFFLYVKEVSVSESPSRRQTAGHLVFFLAVVLLMLPFYLLPGEEKIRIIGEGASLKTLVPVWWIDLAVLVQMGGYLVRVFLMVQEHETDMRRHFSNLNRVSLRWIKYFLYGIAGIFLLVLFLMAVQFWMDRANLALPLFEYWDQRVVPIAVSLCLYIAGYRALVEPDILSGETMVRPTPSDRKQAVRESSSLQKKLLDYMETGQPYRNPELTLPQLAQEIGIPRNQLSSLINEGFGMNFFDFINQYRVDLVKTWLKDPAMDHLTILGLAMEAGFNTKGTFNTAFKKFTGLTPSQYKLV